MIDINRPYIANVTSREGPRVCINCKDMKSQTCCLLYSRQREEWGDVFNVSFHEARFIDQKVRGAVKETVSRYFRRGIQLIP